MIDSLGTKNEVAGVLVMEAILLLSGRETASANCTQMTGNPYNWG